MSAATIARMCGIPRSTTYQLLAQLRERELVAVDDDGRWTPGERLPQIAGDPPTLTEAVAVLDAFERGPERVDAATIARRAGIDPARAPRLLALLQAESLITHDEGLFGLGARLALLVDKFRPLEELRTAARPALLDLREQTGETANLLVLDRDVGVYLDQAEGSHHTRIGWTGRHVPLTGATGRALTAEHRVYTAHGVIEPGVSAIACGLTGSPAYRAAISVTGPSHRLRPRLAEIGSLVAAASAEISARLSALSRRPPANLDVPR